MIRNADGTAVRMHRDVSEKTVVITMRSEECETEASA